MSAVYVTIPKIELKFFLFADQLSPALDKKLAEIGWPSIWLTYSLDRKLKLKELPDGKFTYVSGDFGESIPLTKATENGSASVSLAKQDHSITLQLEGEFLVYGFSDDESIQSFKKIREGFVNIIKLQDVKGKLIKLPKDEYGMANPLEAVSSLNEYDGGYYRVPLHVVVKDG
jgi:hypothetical protein